MRQLLLALMITLVGMVSALAQAPNPAQTPATATPPEPQRLPFYKEIRKTVVFLELVCKSGTAFKDIKGTGFFVWYPDKRLGDGGGFTYLVTNRHVAMCWDDETRIPLEVKSISARVNTRDGSSLVVPLNTSGNVPWIVPTDESVDLALLPLLPEGKKVDYLAIPLEIFASDDVVKNRDISEGTRIVFTGFFYQFPGVQRMQPIIREGVLAMMPDEQMITTTGKRGTLYLGDVHIFHGNSGSPVFVNLGGIQGNRISGDQYFFLGVVSGMFTEKEEFQLEIATTVRGETEANSGIATIVPANALTNLLEDPRVQGQRDVDVANWKQSK
ncbi:MAG: serine protease [Acidobacteriia bacterium]|nr:serine protease [Terriglobia bacterium]